MPWICGSGDSMTVPVRAMEPVGIATERARSARVWSPVVGVAILDLVVEGASWLHAAESAAVATSPAAALGAVSETSRSRPRVTARSYCLVMSYSFRTTPVGDPTGAVSRPAHRAD